MDGSQKSNDLFYLLEQVTIIYLLFILFIYFIYRCGLTFGNTNLMLRDNHLDEFQGFEKVRGKSRWALVLRNAIIALGIEKLYSLAFTTMQYAGAIQRNKRDTT